MFEFPQDFDYEFYKNVYLPTKKFNEEQIGPILFFDANAGMTDIIENVEEHGGKVLLKKTLIRNVSVDGSFIIPKTLIDGKMGYFAYIMDSEGNKLGLYSNS